MEQEVLSAELLAELNAWWRRAFEALGAPAARLDGSRPDGPA